MNRGRLRELMFRRGVVSILVWVLVAFLLLFLALSLVALLCGDEFILAIINDIKESIGSSAK